MGANVRTYGCSAPARHTSATIFDHPLWVGRSYSSIWGQSPILALERERRWKRTDTSVRFHRDGNGTFFRDSSRRRGLAARLACGQYKQPNYQSDASHKLITIIASEPFSSLKSHLHHERLPQVISVRESILDAVAAIELLYNLQEPIRSAARVIEQALLNGKKVLTCGNGGSAADSSHLATEIACRFVGDRRPFPAISLSADGGLLTATANDYSFDEVFSRQAIAFGTPADVLIPLSTSGQSDNVGRALEQAKALDLHSVAILVRA